MIEPTPPRKKVSIVPSWGWWLLFGVNAIMALYWATIGDVGLVAAISGFVAGIALMEAVMTPLFQDMMDNFDSLFEVTQRLQVGITRAIGPETDDENDGRP